MVEGEGPLMGAERRPYSAKAGAESLKEGEGRSVSEGEVRERKRSSESEGGPGGVADRRDLWDQ